VRLGWLVECLKRLLVEEANAIAAPDSPRHLPVSTVAMLKGLHRTDVRRLRREQGAGGRRRGRPVDPQPRAGGMDRQRRQAGRRGLAQARAAPTVP
jgi:hypothetical protein